MELLGKQNIGGKGFIFNSGSTALINPTLELRLVCNSQPWEGKFSFCQTPRSWLIWWYMWNEHRAPSHYPKRRLFVRSREVSKPRDLYLELSDRSEIWQALRQHCCRCACQISKRYDNLKYQSRGFETSRNLTKRRFFGYWDGALVSRCQVASGEWKTQSVIDCLN